MSKLTLVQKNEVEKAADQHSLGCLSIRTVGECAQHLPLQGVERPDVYVGVCSGDRYVRSWIACFRSVLLIYCHLQPFD